MHKSRPPARWSVDQKSGGRTAFEEASTLAMMKVLGIKEFHRGFDTIWESYNELVRSRPKILDGISKACEAWFKNPGASEFERLAKMFKLARTHVIQ